MGLEKNNVHSETELQYVQKTMVCPFSAEQSIEITNCTAVTTSARGSGGVHHLKLEFKRMTESGTDVETRAQESGVPEGIISLESCSGQVGGLYGC